MFLGLLLLVVVGLVGLLLLVGVLALVVALSARPDAAQSTEVAWARRHATLTSVLSVGTLVAVPVVLVGVVGVTVALHRGLGVSEQLVASGPLLAVVAAVVVLLLGELSWPRPTGRSRTALLHDRSLRSLLDGPWPRAAAGSAVLLALVLVVAGVAADDDGRSITHTWPQGASTAGPFPGWFYGGPQLTGLAVALALAAVTARAAAHRSTVVSAEVAADELLRRASVARVSRLVVAGCLVTLGADLLLGGLAVGNAFSDTRGHALGTAMLVTAPLLLLAGLVSLLLPVPRLPAYLPVPGPHPDSGPHPDPGSAAATPTSVA